MRDWRRAAGFVVVLAMAAATLAASPLIASASTSTCADVYIAGARGSGESATNNGGFGTPVGDAASTLKVGLGSQYTVAYGPVTYPASAVPWSLLMSTLNVS